MNEMVEQFLSRMDVRKAVSDAPLLALLLNCVIAGEISGGIGSFRSDLTPILALGGIAVSCFGLALTTRRVGRFSAAAACVWGGFGVTFTGLGHQTGAGVWIAVSVWWATTVVIGSSVMAFRTRQARNRERRRAMNRAALARAVLMAGMYGSGGAGQAATLR